MYRIYDTPAAIREVQIYLGLAGNPDIIVVPSGVYDDNTRLSVTDFQRTEGLGETGVVNRETFDKLYEVYAVLRDIEELKSNTDSFITFPVLPSMSSNGMVHINGMLSRLLDYYGYTHNLRESRFYSSETDRATKTLRKIYRLEDGFGIDEILYIRMVKDHDSIGSFNGNFS